MRAQIDANRHALRKHQRGARIQAVEVCRGHIQMLPKPCVSQYDSWNSIGKGQVDRRGALMDTQKVTVAGAQNWHKIREEVRVKC